MRTVRADPARPVATLETIASTLKVSAFGRQVRRRAPIPLRKIGAASASAPNPAGVRNRPRTVAGAAFLKSQDPTSKRPETPARVSIVATVSSCRSRSFTERWLRSSRTFWSALSEWIWMRLSTDSSRSSSVTRAGSYVRITLEAAQFMRCEVTPRNWEKWFSRSVCSAERYLIARQTIRTRPGRRCANRHFKSGT